MKNFFPYLLAKIEEDEERMLYQVYVSECYRFITENTAHFAGGNIMQAKFFDLLTSNKNSGRKKDNRSGDEIAADVVSRLGLAKNE